MTPEQLAEIEARLKAASPGPWYLDKTIPDWKIRDRNGELIVGIWGLIGGNPAVRYPAESNEQLIIHALSDIAALLVLVHMLMQDSRMWQIEADRLQRILDSRFGELENKVNAGIQELENIRSRAND